MTLGPRWPPGNPYLKLLQFLPWKSCKTKQFRHVPPIGHLHLGGYNPSPRDEVVDVFLDRSFEPNMCDVDRSSRMGIVGIDYIDYFIEIVYWLCYCPLSILFLIYSCIYIHIYIYIPYDSMILLNGSFFSPHPANECPYGLLPNLSSFHPRGRTSKPLADRWVKRSRGFLVLRQQQGLPNFSSCETVARLHIAAVSTFFGVCHLQTTKDCLCYILDIYWKGRAAP